MYEISVNMIALSSISEEPHFLHLADVANRSGNHGNRKKELTQPLKVSDTNKLVRIRRSCRDKRLNSQIRAS